VTNITLGPLPEKDEQLLVTFLRGAMVQCWKQVVGCRMSENQKSEMDMNNWYKSSLAATRIFLFFLLKP